MPWGGVGAGRRPGDLSRADNGNRRPSGRLTVRESLSLTAKDPGLRLGCGSVYAISRAGRSKRQGAAESGTWIDPGDLMGGPERELGGGAGTVGL